MQVTVYIPKEMEPGLLGLAEANGQTIQQVLLTPWKAERVLTKSVDERLDRIESKLDQLICGFGDRPVVNYEHKDLTVESPVAELGKIRGEDKRYVEGWRDPRDTVIDSEGKAQNEVISEHLKNQVDDAQELKEANERLLKKRMEIKGAIKTASDLPDRYKSPEFSGGVPKAKWSE